LTAAERRAAGLAGRGLTNRDIAEALFVTPKTVEYHLRNVFAKLHVSSRTELAALVANGNGSSPSPSSSGE
jgi:DNA-binding CsgD family transcriptional regulator